MRQTTEEALARRSSKTSSVRPASIIHLKRRSGSCWMGCVARTALLSCAVVKAYLRASTTSGRRTSWKPEEAAGWGHSACRKHRRGERTAPEAKDLKEVVAEQTLELRLAQKKHDWRMGATTNEVPCIREAGDHPAGRGKPSVGAPDTGQAGHPPHHILSLV